MRFINHTNPQITRSVKMSDTLSMYLQFQTLWLCTITWFPWSSTSWFNHSSTIKEYLMQQVWYSFSKVTPPSDLGKKLSNWKQKKSCGKLNFGNNARFSDSLAWRNSQYSEIKYSNHCKASSCNLKKKPLTQKLH